MKQHRPYISEHRAGVRALQERARILRHQKRFSPTALAARALRKLENAVVREHERAARRDRKRYTEKGYAELRAAIRKGLG